MLMNVTAHLAPQDHPWGLFLMYLFGFCRLSLLCHSCATVCSIYNVESVGIRLPGQANPNNTCKIPTNKCKWPKHTTHAVHSWVDTLVSTSEQLSAHTCMPWKAKLLPPHLFISLFVLTLLSHKVCERHIGVTGNSNSWKQLLPLN